MRKVLITGMSGTGKSSALAALARLGFQVIDTDEPGWTEWSDHAGGYVWREDRIAELLAREDGPSLYVSGTVSNQGRFYPCFDAACGARSRAFRVDRHPAARRWRASDQDQPPVVSQPRQLLSRTPGRRLDRGRHSLPLRPRREPKEEAPRGVRCGDKGGAADRPGFETARAPFPRSAGRSPAATRCPSSDRSGSWPTMSIALGMQLRAESVGTTSRRKRCAGDAEGVASPSSMSQSTERFGWHRERGP